MFTFKVIIFLFSTGAFIIQLFPIAIFDIYLHQYRSLLVVHQDLALQVLPFVPKKKSKNQNFTSAKDFTSL